MIFFKAFVLLIFLTALCIADSMSESMKRFIYEIETPLSNGIKRGTAFALSDSILGRVLISCRHVVQDTNGNIVDSIYVRKNKISDSKQAFSDTSRFVIYLRKPGLLFVQTHPNDNIDLIAIPVIPRLNTDLSKDELFFALYSNKILDENGFNKLKINEGFEVEVVGFSISVLSLPRESIHYHFSRYGKIGLYVQDKFTLKIDHRLVTADFILLDMIIRGGDSGSPIFTYIGDNMFLIGFIAGTSDTLEFGIGYPVYHIFDLISRLQENPKLFIEPDFGKVRDN